MPRLLSLALVLLAPGLAAAAPPAVSAAAYHPQGKTVAFGLPGAVRLFDPATGGPAGVVPGLTGRVTALAFAPTRNWLAVAAGEPGQSGVVSLVPLDAAGKPAGPAKTAATHKDTVYAVAFSDDGTRLATAGYDRVIQVYELSADGTAKLVHTLRDHSDTIYALAFQPGGLLLASAAADRAVKVWDVLTGTRLYTLGESTDWLYALAWSPDGRHLAAGGVDRSIRVWAAGRSGGRLVHSVFAHQRPVSRLGYTGDGAALFSVGEGGVIKAWDAAKMAETRVFPTLPDAVLGFAVRRDGKQLAVGLFDGTALLFDAATAKTTAQPLPLKLAPPKAERLNPTGVPRGKTTRVLVNGTNLDHATAVKAHVPGVEAKIVPGGTPAGSSVEVTVAPTAPIGPVQLTLEGPAGKSAPLPLAIDRHPAVPESGNTDSARQAMPVGLPATVVGAVDRAGDVDYFRFTAKAGDEIGVQVVAAELGSKLDPALVLTDADGLVLAEGGAVLGFRVPAAGGYAIGVRDRDYRGGAEFTYRLQLGDVPVVTGVFPLGVQRGTTATVRVSGVNLGRQTLAVPVTVPADAAPGSKVPVPLPPSADRPLGSATVIVDEFPSVVIDPTTTTQIPVPGSADGILAKPGDARTVRFAAKKGERLIVEVAAARAGSPVDSVAEVLDSAGKPVPRAVLRATTKTFVAFRDHDSNSPGIRLTVWPDLGVDDYLYIDGELMKILALPRNPDDDCQFYQVGGRRVGFLDTTPCHHSMDSPMYRVEVHPPGTTFPPNGQPVFALNYRNDDGGPGYGTDSRLFFDPPADGVYQVRVSDSRGAGGPTHAFRVTVRPPRPDFSLTFNPTAPAVWKGGAVPVSVTATRRDGFDGPVRVKLDGLPPGFQAPETTIEAGQISTAFALFAAEGAAVPTNTKIRLVGTATIGGKTVTHEAAGGTPTLADPGDLRTTVREQTIVIRPGQETRFTVDIERRNGFAGRVPLDVRGLPHGVRVLNVGLNGILVTERDTSREVALYCEPWVKPTEHPIVILSRREGKNTEHAARAVTLRVQP